MVQTGNRRSLAGRQSRGEEKQGSLQATRASDGEKKLSLGLFIETNHVVAACKQLSLIFTSIRSPSRPREIKIPHLPEARGLNQRRQVEENRKTNGKTKSSRGQAPWRLQAAAPHASRKRAPLLCFRIHLDKLQEQDVFSTSSGRQSRGSQSQKEKQTYLDAWNEETASKTREKKVRSERKPGPLFSTSPLSSLSPSPSPSRVAPSSKAQQAAATSSMSSLHH